MIGVRYCTWILVLALAPFSGDAASMRFLPVPHAGQGQCGTRRGIGGSFSILYPQLNLRGGKRKKRVEKAKVQDKILKTIEKSESRKTRYKAGTKDYVPLDIPYLYVIGGRSTQFELSIVQKYDVTTKDWTSSCKLESPRAYSAAVRFGNKIYLIGGIYNNQPLNSVRSFSPYSSDLAWKVEKMMPFARRNFASAVLDNQIFIFGGTGTPRAVFDTEQPEVCFSSVQSFLPDFQFWQNHTDMPMAKQFCAAVSCGDRIYVMGGYSNNAEGDAPDQDLDSVHSYDPVLRLWREEPPMPTPRANFQAVAISGRIYAIGGMSGGAQRADVESYDPKTREWRAEPPLIQKRSAFAAECFNGYIYVAGKPRRKLPTNNWEESMTMPQMK
eukprot:96388-Hanusia_phi.AAC.2